MIESTLVRLKSAESPAATSSASLVFSDATRLYLDHIKIERGLSKDTVYSYASWLHHFEKWLKENGYPSPTLAAFNTAVLTRFLHVLHGRNLRPRSIRGVFYPLRGMGDYLVIQGYLTDNPANKITLPKKDAAIRQTVTDAEVASLLDAAGRIRQKQRAALARAVFSVFIFGGLRRSETIARHYSHTGWSAPILWLFRAFGESPKKPSIPDPIALLISASEWV